VIIYFFISALVSLVFSFSLYRLSLKYKLVDTPNKERKHHATPTPNIGGIALFAAFWITTILFVLIYQVQGEYLTYLTGLFLGSLLLLVIGIIDDRINLSPSKKLIGQVVASGVIIASGVGVSVLASPFGGFLHLDQINIGLFTIQGVTYHLTLIADALALLWIITLINTFNFLDGLDGLAAGTAAIAFFVITILSQNPLINQPLSAIIALIALGAIVGFLPFNLPPAKMFMGDSGSTFLGFLLAVLAIIAGSKLATALLVLGLPIFDSLWVVSSRILKGKKPWEAGRDHLHHKLLQLGISSRWVVIIFWTITATFGAISLLTQGSGKLVALVIFITILVIAMTLIELRLRKIKRAEA